MTMKLKISKTNEVNYDPSHMDVAAKAINSSTGMLHTHLSNQLSFKVGANESRAFSI